MNDDHYFDVASESMSPTTTASVLPDAVLAAADEVSQRLCFSPNEQQFFLNELQLFQSWWHSQVPGLPMTRCTREHARVYCKKYLRGMPTADRQNRLLRFAELWQVMLGCQAVSENVFGTPSAASSGWTIHADIQRMFSSSASSRPCSPLPATPAVEGEPQGEDSGEVETNTVVDTDDEWNPSPSPYIPPAPVSLPVSQRRMRALSSHRRLPADLPALRRIIEQMLTRDDMHKWRDALLIVMAYLKPGASASELVKLTVQDVLDLEVDGELVAGRRRWPLHEPMRKWLNDRPPESPAFVSCRLSDHNGSSVPEPVAASSVSQMLSRAGSALIPPVSLTMRSLMLMTPDDDDADEEGECMDAEEQQALPEPVHALTTIESPAPAEPAEETPMPTDTSAHDEGVPSNDSAESSWDIEHAVDQLAQDIVRAWGGRLMGSVEMIEQVTGEPAHLWQRMVQERQLPAMRRLDGQGCLVLARVVAHFICKRTIASD